MTRRLALGGLIAAVLASDPVRAECSAVSVAATEHTCSHGALGPFETVPAQTYPGFVFTELNQPHTFYTLTLGDTADVDHHAVSFWPVASGPIGIYMKTKFPLVVRDAAGVEVPVALEHAVTCSVEGSLTWVKAFAELSDAKPYTLDIGPTGEASVSLAIEYLSAFVRPWYQDEDRDGWGGALATESWCEPSDGFAARGEDCNDADPAVFPGAAEACNGVDDDCDSVSESEAECAPAEAEGGAGARGEAIGGEGGVGVGFGGAPAGGEASSGAPGDVTENPPDEPGCAYGRASDSASSLGALLVAAWGLWRRWRWGGGRARG